MSKKEYNEKEKTCTVIQEHPKAEIDKYLNVLMDVNTLSGDALIQKLYDLGLLDSTLVKVGAIRSFIHAKIRDDNMKKVDAMYAAAEHFSVSYGYVRKAMYYYTNINF